MAYFECNLGGGGGGETDVNLIVTCSSTFAGKVITCTNGTDTYTQTCPSTSPYTVTFENIEKGTWTVSGVISGQTFSQSVTISDYTVELNSIPDGATVTPVNDIQTWLHCANIWNKTYTTISQVLSDTSTLLALISSNNAADYMARSTNWASSVCANSTAMGYIGNNNYCANKLLSNSTWATAICNSTYFESVLKTKIPTMTSNTTPSGSASATNAQSGREAYRAFDSNDSTESAPNTGTYAPWQVQYQFASQIQAPKKLYFYVYYMYQYNNVSGVVEILNASNNTWESIATLVSGAHAQYGEDKQTIVLNKTGNYSAIRLRLITGGNLDGNQAYGFFVRRLQIWGR